VIFTAVLKSGGVLRHFAHPEEQNSIRCLSFCPEWGQSNRVYLDKSLGGNEPVYGFLIQQFLRCRLWATVPV